MNETNTLIEHLFGNFQSVVALSIAANLAYLNIQNLKYVERSRKFIRERFRDQAAASKKLIQKANEQQSYERIYQYGDLQTFETDMDAPKDNYDHGGSKFYFNLLFMKPLFKNQPITLDKLFCALALTLSVVVFLHFTFSLSKPSNGTYTFFEYELKYEFFYPLYTIALWIVPLIMTITAVGFFLWDAAQVKKDTKFSPGKKVAAKWVVFSGFLIVLLFLFSLYSGAITSLTITEDSLRFWIFISGILLFIPTYLVTFASFAYPVIEKEIEKDINALHIFEPTKKSGSS